MVEGYSCVPRKSRAAVIAVGLQSTFPSLENEQVSKLILDGMENHLGKADAGRTLLLHRSTSLILPTIYSAPVFLRLRVRYPDLGLDLASENLIDYHFSVYYSWPRCTELHLCSRLCENRNLTKTIQQ